MCPGCMTAAALQELGLGPFAALRAAFTKAPAGPTSPEPSTPPDTAKAPAVEETKDAE